MRSPHNFKKRAAQSPHGILALLDALKLTHEEKVAVLEGIKKRRQIESGSNSEVSHGL